jgi:hypothetical protein
MHLVGFEFIDQVHQSFHTAPEPIQLPDHEGIGLAQLRTAPPSAPDVRPVLPLASCLDLQQALPTLVNHQRRQTFASHWGEGTTSSSDGQRFQAGGRGEEAGQVNLRYGTELACCSTRTYRTSTHPSLGRPRGFIVAERHQRENASKVATHLAVLVGMDKKTGPRYQPRLNILRCFTLVHAFRTGKPQKAACAMILPTHTDL